MIAFGTAVALQAGHTVLAGALAVRLVADLATGAHGVAVARPARLLVRHWFVAVPEVALLAVVTVTTSGVVTALVANPAGYSA